MRRLLIFNLKTDADDQALGFTTAWINALAAHVESIDVITMQAGRLATAANVRVHSLGRERGYSEPRRLLAFYSILARVMRERRPEAAFAHMNHLFASLAAPVLKPAGIPSLLWYAHGAVPPALRIAHRLVDRVVTSSASGFAIDSPKRVIIGQGIDTHVFRPRAGEPAERCFRIVTVGRIGRVKRLDLAIDAVAAAAAARPDAGVRFDLFGDPITDEDQSLRGRLIERIDALGLQDSVRILPGIPFARVHEAYQGADLFLNCGATNSVDKVVLEAMSSALPAVTCNFAFAEILPPAIGAHALAEPTPPALAQALMWWIDQSPRSRLQRGLEMRRFVEQEHSLDRLAQRIIAELTDLVNHRDARR